MARELTQADINLAETLLAAQRPDDQIVAALAHRGLESNVASTLIQDLRTGVEPNPKLAAAVEEALITGVPHRVTAAFLVILFAVFTTGGFVLLWVELFERGEKMYRGPIAALILAGGVVVSMLAGAFLRCRAGRWWFVFLPGPGRLALGRLVLPSSRLALGRFVGRRNWRFASFLWFGRRVLRGAASFSPPHALLEFGRVAQLALAPTPANAMTLAKRNPSYGRHHLPVPQVWQTHVDRRQRRWDDGLLPALC